MLRSAVIALSIIKVASVSWDYTLNNCLESQNVLYETGAISDEDHCEE